MPTYTGRSDGGTQIRQTEIVSVPVLPQRSPAPGPAPTLEAVADGTRVALEAGQHNRSCHNGLLAASSVQRLTKRLVDIVLSSAVLLLLTPVLALAGVAVATSSRGPILYIDWRVGRDGRRFRMYKFRSMHIDADRRLERLRSRNEVSGPVFKMRCDPRITRVGSVMRKFSIDELPQLLNVLRGDMSLVGPRPPLPAEYETYSSHQRQRLSVKPGITCTWQVSGRSDIPFDEWVEMDLDYIERWNLLLDLTLLLRTLPAVLSARGAY